MFSQVEHARPNSIPQTLVDTEIGVDLETLPAGDALEVQTGHHVYRIENRGQGRVVISGHPSFCPEPVEVKHFGATNGISTVKMWRVESGMRMEFRHPELGLVRTSRVTQIQQIPALATV